MNINITSSIYPSHSKLSSMENIENLEMEGIRVDEGLNIQEMVSTSTNVDELFKTLMDTYPDTVVHIQKILQLSADKMYHELAEEFFEFIQEPNLSSIHKLKFFLQFITGYKEKISPIKFVQMLGYITQLLDTNDAAKLYYIYKDYASIDLEANLLFMCNRVEILTEIGLFKKCEAILSEVKSKLDENEGVELQIFVSFHRNSAKLYKKMNRLTDFYKHATLYLSYTQLSTLKDEKYTLAYDMAIAAILSPDVYEFAELLEMPIIKENLQYGENNWLYEILVEFRKGNIRGFCYLLEKYQYQISQSELKYHKDAMREKITLLALMELAFNRPKKMRKFTFSEIAEYCQVQDDQVEQIVMLSMSNNLIKGRIDEVEKIVNINYIKPGILDNAGLEVMRRRIDVWSESAKELLLYLEKITPELLVS